VLKRAEGLLADLDDDQKRAVTHGEGPLLVVAGAGSGKTRVLTYRIAWLLANGLAQSHEVLAVTFTNKAAREMAGRVETLVGGSLRGGFVGTFHRFALQTLRSHPREAGLPPRFAIADEDEQRTLVERVLKKLDVPSSRVSPRAARSRISAAKNAMVTPEQLASRARGSDERLIAELYEAYQAELRTAGAVDFDDMLLSAVSLLEREQALRKGLASRFRWILVDEYQDTNLAQAQLVWLLGGKRPNLTAVGDEDQSIYRWRGAEIENILNFEATYPESRVVTLGRNYRSAEPILQAAAAVIAHNARRRPRTLLRGRARRPGERYLAADEGDEARFVADEIERLRSTTSLGEVAVLFRVNASRAASRRSWFGGRSPTRWWRHPLLGTQGGARRPRVPATAGGAGRRTGVPARGPRAGPRDRAGGDGATRRRRDGVGSLAARSGAASPRSADTTDAGSVAGFLPAP
jgi:DNA helicase-2/ATP-dependent DNA helicase PcrA